MLYEHLGEVPVLKVTNFKEELGKGIEGIIDGNHIKLGSSDYVGGIKKNTLQTVIFLSINHDIKGKFVFDNTYREGMSTLFSELQKSFELSILTGDNEGERKYLESQLPKGTHFIFNQKPENKLNYIKQLQRAGKKVLMIGDGLNDAGALAQSDVGIALSENINVFSPASDGIIDARQFKLIPRFIKLSQQTMTVIKISFVLSFLYNFIGMLFAVTGNLSPIVAAILMPLSSISIVIFVTIMTNILANKK
jgi:Cu+-exporting ATPase